MIFIKKIRALLREYISNNFINYFLGVFFYVFFVVSGLIVGLGSSGLIKKINPLDIKCYFYGVIIFEIILLSCGIIVGKYFFSKIKDDDKINIIPVVDLKTKTKKYIIILSLTMIAGFVFLSSYISFVLNPILGIEDRQSTVSVFLLLGLPLSLFTAVLIGGLEELIFRKGLQGGLEKYLVRKNINFIKKFKIHIWFPIVISSAVFALVHFQGKYSFVIFVLGLILGVIYFVFKSVKLNILIHGINNTIGILLIFGSIGSLENEYINLQKNIDGFLPDKKIITYQNNFNVFIKK